MKNLITPPYVFTPGASGVGTIDTGIVNFDAKLLLAIINITRGEVIYAPQINGKGYTAIVGDTITLDYSTASHNAADILQFFYDSTADYPAVVSGPLTNTELRAAAVDVSTGELIAALEAMRMAMVSLTRNLAQVYPDTAGRQRVVVDAITGGLTLGTVSTVSNIAAGTITTVSTVTNQAQAGGIAINEQMASMYRMAAETLRRNISVT